MLVTIISILLLTAPPDVTMTASATRTKVGDTITLTIRAQGPGQIATPSTPGFTVVRTSRFVSFKTHQGERTHESTLTLELRALKRGRHRIEGARLLQDGQTLATAKPVRILVMRGKGPNPKLQDRHVDGGTRPEIPYVGQVFRLFGPKRLQAVSGIDLPASATRVDTSAGPPILLKSGEVQLGIFTINTAGRHTLGPVQYTSGVFGGPMTIPARDITVRALPKRGRPAHATELVGPIQMTASLRRLTGGTHTHELVATVTGASDLSVMNAPEVRMARGVRAEEPTSSSAAFDPIALVGSRTFRWQLTVPNGKAPRLKLRAHYFDPVRRKWRTATARP